MVNGFDVGVTILDDRCRLIFQPRWMRAGRRLVRTHLSFDRRASNVFTATTPSMRG